MERTTGGFFFLSQILKFFLIVTAFCMETGFCSKTGINTYHTQLVNQEVRTYGHGSLSRVISIEVKCRDGPNSTKERKCQSVILRFGSSMQEIPPGNKNTCRNNVFHTIAPPRSIPILVVVFFSLPGCQKEATQKQRKTNQ